jgi:hypothetical protein
MSDAWMIGVLVVWAFVALGVALVVGRGIHLADGRSNAEHTLTTADLPAGFTTSPSAPRR